MTIEKYFGIGRDIARQMIEDTKNRTHSKSGDNGFQLTKVFLFDEYAVLKMQNLNVRNVDMPDPDLRHLERLVKTLLDLQTEGVGVVPILSFQCDDDGNGYVIQSRAKGTELYDRDRMTDKGYVLERVKLLSNAPQKHFDKFVADWIKITDAGILVDFMGKDNFFYDETIGFQFIDLIAHHDYEYGLDDEKPQAKLSAARNCFIPCYFDIAPKHRETVPELLSKLTDEERAALVERNRMIFNKCRTALLNNGIAEEMIDKAVKRKGFAPQMRQLGLV